MAKNSQEATIYGAGMSGLIAAVNLAREGYSVTVHDREPGYGGSALYNPSTHVTPLDPAETSNYIGIDITPVFHQVLACPSYFHETKVQLPVEGVFGVERGNRPTSLDTLLYDECQGLGVKFEFDSPLKKEQLSNLPPNTIIACGLIPAAYEMLDIPYLRWYGWISRGEIGIGSYAWLWWDECISEYGYLSAVNNYYFNLLFSIREVDKNALDKYKSFMVRNEGIEHDNWDYVSGAVPIAVPDNPRLFWNDAVLCGTISGAMDPFMWFGISGALVTGKVAALAVMDRDRGLAEFDRFTRKYKGAYAVKNKLWYKFVRPNVTLMEKGIQALGVSNVERLGQLIPSGKVPVKMAVPGFSYMSCN
jgi:flavin-dependent dehydrogenase